MGSAHYSASLIKCLLLQCFFFVTTIRRLTRDTINTYRDSPLHVICGLYFKISGNQSIQALKKKQLKFQKWIGSIYYLDENTASCSSVFDTSWCWNKVLLEKVQKSYASGLFVWVIVVIVSIFLVPLWFWHSGIYFVYYFFI